MNIIKTTRQTLGLTRQELAELIDNAKITRDRICQYENGSRIPKYETCCLIANGLDISVDILLSGLIKKKNEMRENLNQEETKESKRFLELLLDGYVIFWQAMEDKVMVEDLNLAVHYLEKDKNVVEVIRSNGIVTIFKKKGSV